MSCYCIHNCFVHVPGRRARRWISSASSSEPPPCQAWWCFSTRPRQSRATTSHSPSTAAILNWALTSASRTVRTYISWSQPFPLTMASGTQSPLTGRSRSYISRSFISRSWILRSYQQKDHDIFYFCHFFFSGHEFSIPCFYSIIYCSPWKKCLDLWLLWVRFTEKFAIFYLQRE